MSIEIYNALLLAVREEVCLKLSLGGFGELDSMLKALNMVDRDCDCGGGVGEEGGGVGGGGGEGGGEEEGGEEG